MQEKIPQSSQIIHELGIKREAIVLCHKYSPMPKCIYKYICVSGIYIFISEEEIPLNPQGYRRSL